MVLDIGGGGCSAAFIEVFEDENIHILGKGECIYPHPGFSQGAMYDPELVSKCAHDAIQNATKKEQHPPKELILSTTSKYMYGTQVHMVKTRQEDYAPISLSEMRSILHQSQSKSFQKAKDEISLELGTDDDTKIELLTSTLNRVMVDNYAVTNPVGMPGKSLDIRFYNAFAPASTERMLQNIGKQLGYTILGIIPRAYSVANILPLIEDESLSAICLYIGGQTTEIFVLHDGDIHKQKTIPLGDDHIVKRIQTLRDKDMFTAQTIKEAYIDDVLSSEDKEHIQMAIEPELDTWVSAIELTLWEFGIDPLPKLIMICGGGSKLPDRLDILNRAKLHERLPFIETPNIRKIHAKQLPYFRFKEKTLDMDTSLPLLGSALFAQDLSGNKSLL